MKIEVGKSYRTRDGGEVVITDTIDNHPYVYVGMLGTDCLTFTKEGKWRYNSSNEGYDLVAPLEEEGVKQVGLKLTEMEKGILDGIFDNYVDSFNTQSSITEKEIKLIQEVAVLKWKLDMMLKEED